MLTITKQDIERYKKLDVILKNSIDIGLFEVSEIAKKEMLKIDKNIPWSTFGGGNYPKPKK